MKGEEEATVLQVGREVLSDKVKLLISTLSNEYVLLGVAVGISAFFHLSYLGWEFARGEDEINAAQAALRFLYGFADYRYFLTIFLWSQPPLRAWVLIPFILTLGVSEFALRLPSALLGAATTALIYLAGRKLYSARVALLASFIYSVSGISHPNRLGGGLMTFLITSSFFCLVASWTERNEQQRGAWFAMLALTFTALTYSAVEESVFFLGPALYILLRRHGARFFSERVVLYSCLIYTVAVSLLFVAPVAYALRHHCMDIDCIARVGIFNHLASRVPIAAHAYGARDLGAIAIFQTFVAHNSAFYVVLLVMPALYAAIFRRKEVKGLNVFFPLPYLLFWILTDWPVMGYVLRIIPFLSLISSVGILQLFDWLRHRFRSRLSAPLRIAVMTFLIASWALSGWHNYVVFCQTGLEPSRATFVSFTDSWLHSHGRPVIVGTKAAGYFIRKNSSPEDQVLTDLGLTALISFYTGRRDSGKIRQILLDKPSPEALPSLLSQAAGFEKVAYIITEGGSSLLRDYAERNCSLAAVVTVRNRETLYIYDTQREVLAPRELKHEEYAVLFDREYSDWKTRLWGWFTIQGK